MKDLELFEIILNNFRETIFSAYDIHTITKKPVNIMALALKRLYDSGKLDKFVRNGNQITYFVETTTIDGNNK